MAMAMAHDGKIGWEVFEMVLPESIVERYCVKRHPPDVKAFAMGRVTQTFVQLPQENPTHRPDNDPNFVAETLE